MRFMRSASIVALFSTLTLVGCAASNGAAEPGEARAASDSTDFSGDFRPIEADSATMIVRGLSCPKCANNVNLQLDKIAGIENTTIDMGAGEVRVQFSQLAARKPSKAQLARAITDAGFTVVDIRTP